MTIFRADDDLVMGVSFPAGPSLFSVTKEVFQAYAGVSASALVGGDDVAENDFISAILVANVKVADEMRLVHG
jgi:hypothetical protein